MKKTVLYAIFEEDVALSGTGNVLCNPYHRPYGTFLISNGRAAQHVHHFHLCRFRKNARFALVIITVISFLFSGTYMQMCVE